jgi:hypothetical protein
MKNKGTKDDKRGHLPKPPGHTNDVPLQPAGEIVVSHEEAASKPSPEKQIHPRRPLPPVPEKPTQLASDARGSDETDQAVP